MKSFFHSLFCFVQGFDTHGAVIACLLILLAIHDEHQSRVYQELLEIFGTSDRLPDEDDLKRMVYLEMCIKEAIRHGGPPAVARSVDEDIVIGEAFMSQGRAIKYP